MRYCIWIWIYYYCSKINKRIFKRIWRNFWESSRGVEGWLVWGVSRIFSLRSRFVSIVRKYVRFYCKNIRCKKGVLWAIFWEGCLIGFISCLWDSTFMSLFCRIVIVMYLVWIRVEVWRVWFRCLRWCILRIFCSSLGLGNFIFFYFFLFILFFL